MVKRLIDILASASALVVLSPLLVFAAVGILVSSPGPVLFRAMRAGLGGRPFTMYKFRTMHVCQGGFRSAITAAADPRVFRFGAWLRRLKVDELPQLINILKGDMSLVGPRPEDPRIVEAHYAPLHLETLNVLPGLASPGSIYNYTHGERLLSQSPSGAERLYVERLLPVKLALEVVYVREASLLYDLKVVLRTAATIAATAAGRKRFPEPAEIKKAAQFVVQTRSARQAPAPAPPRARAAQGTLA